MKKSFFVLFTILTIFFFASCKNEIPEVIRLTIDCENLSKGDSAYYVCKVDENFDSNIKYKDIDNYPCLTDLTNKDIKTSINENPMSKIYYLSRQEYRIAIIIFNEKPNDNSDKLYEISKIKVLVFDSDIKVTILGTNDIITS